MPFALGSLGDGAVEAAVSLKKGVSIGMKNMVKRNAMDRTMVTMGASTIRNFSKPEFDESDELVARRVVVPKGDDTKASWGSLASDSLLMESESPGYTIVQRTLPSDAATPIRIGPAA